MTILDPRNLTRTDLRTSTWERLEKDMRERLDALRIENDSFSDHDTTTKRRGRIAELKEWLSLAQQAQSSEAGLDSSPASFRPPQRGT